MYTFWDVFYLDVYLGLTLVSLSENRDLCHPSLFFFYVASLFPLSSVAYIIPCSGWLPLASGHSAAGGHRGCRRLLLYRVVIFSIPPEMVHKQYHSR